MSRFLDLEAERTLRVVNYDFSEGDVGFLNHEMPIGIIIDPLELTGLAMSQEAAAKLGEELIAISKEPVPDDLDTAPLKQISEEEIYAELAEENEEALTLDGLIEAYLGPVRRKGSPTVALYSRERIIKILMDRDGMDYEGAVEFYDYNIADAYVGPNTPAFV